MLKQGWAQTQKMRYILHANFTWIKEVTIKVQVEEQEENYINGCAFKKRLKISHRTTKDASMFLLVRTDMG